MGKEKQKAMTPSLRKKDSHGCFPLTLECHGGLFLDGLVYILTEYPLLGPVCYYYIRKQRIKLLGPLLSGFLGRLHYKWCCT